MEKWAEMPPPNEIAHPIGRQAVPQNRRNRCETGREIQNSRINTRPALAKGEWARLEASIALGEYKNAKNGAIGLRTIHQKLMVEPGENERQKSGDRVGRKKKPARRQLDELRSDNWVTKDKLHKSKACSKSPDKREDGNRVAGVVGVGD